jgi:hypothetical protein
MSDNMHGNPDEMETFAGQLQVPNYVMSTTVGEAGCGGQGLPECATLRNALELATLKAGQLAREMTAGMQSFANITRTCAAEYNANDSKHTLEITRTMAALPSQTERVDLVETTDFGPED